MCFHFVPFTYTHIFLQKAERINMILLFLHLSTVCYNTMCQVKTTNEHFRVDSMQNEATSKAADPTCRKSLNDTEKIFVHS